MRNYCTFLECRKAFVHKPTDRKSFQQRIIMCYLMGNFLIPLAKVAFSDVRSSGAGVTHGLHSDRLYWVFSQIVSFWQALYFHKVLFLSVYLQGDFFFFVMLGVGSIWQSFEVWNLNVPDFAAVARHRVVVVILWCSRCRPSHPSIMLYRMECLSAFPEGLAGWKVSVGQTPLIPTTVGKVGGILWKLNSSSGISLLLWDRKETSVQAGQAATYWGWQVSSDIFFCSG